MRDEGGHLGGGHIIDESEGGSLEGGHIIGER